ncbi:MAG: CHAT domain-containing protein [Rhizonema sp. PD38]|nr:CHAT domain-containing protein [Rhizonema sp. PD38]
MPKIQVKSGRKLLSWTLTIAVAALFVNVPNSTGQSQPPQSAEQRAALKEATGLNQQVIQLYKEGKYSIAIPLAERVLLIREKVLGKEHPDVAQSLNNLALLYKAQGNYQKAEPLYQRSLNIREKVLGKEHPDVAISLNNLVLLYWAEGDITRATDFYSRGLAVEEHNLKLIEAVGSEQRKQGYARTFAGSTDSIITLSQQQGNKNPEIARLALTTVLRRKGLVLDAVADGIQTIRSEFASQPETQKLFDEWLNVQQQLSALVYIGQGKQCATDYQTQYQHLVLEKERLEEAISVKSAEFRNQTQPVELQAIQSHIPQDAAIVEIVQYQPFDHKAKKEDEKWGKSHYAAAVLRSSGEPKWVDLGDAATIDKLIAELRTALALAGSRSSIEIQPINGTHKNSLPQVQQLARKVDQLVMAPIRPLLGDARHLLLSPDGQLTLIPFEALVDEKGKYLIQSYAFSYLTSGRDLLRLQSVASSQTAPVVFADVDYNRQTTIAAAQSSNTVRGVQNRRSQDLASVSFPPLSNTKEEAEKIKAIFPETTLKLGQSATETAIKQLNSPSILHLATHGFFLSDPEVKLANDEFGKQPKVLNLENPLLRSGLALAGANNRNQVSSGTNDGVLTALEVAGLSLRGTQLVVLSACETGLGDVKVGDGLYGLRRALVIAGSQSQVLSLWKVSDAGTKELMVKYYLGLKAGKGRHEALRDAQLEMLKNPSYQHPFYWASFVPSGDWTPLHK